MKVIHADGQLRALEQSVHGSTTCTTQGSFSLLFPIFPQAVEAVETRQVRSLGAWVRTLVAAVLTDRIADCCLYPRDQRSLGLAVHSRAVTNELDSKLISTFKRTEFSKDRSRICKLYLINKRQPVYDPGGSRGRLLWEWPICGWRPEVAVQRGLYISERFNSDPFVCYSRTH